MIILPVLSHPILHSPACMHALRVCVVCKIAIQLSVGHIHREREKQGKGHSVIWAYVHHQHQPNAFFHLHYSHHQPSIGLTNCCLAYRVGWIWWSRGRLKLFGASRGGGGRPFVVANCIHHPSSAARNVQFGACRYNSRRSVDALSIDFSNAPVPPYPLTGDVARPHRCWMDGIACPKRTKTRMGWNFASIHFMRTCS